MNADKHLYQNGKFNELIDDAAIFFSNIPTITYRQLGSFKGVGVYALYYNGNNEYYIDYLSQKPIEMQWPIYVGKAVPAGWRQAKSALKDKTGGTELFRRLNEHKKSIDLVANLSVAEFTLKYMKFDENLIEMISTVESRLINKLQPLWNTTVDGFGNHDPGKGRYQQAKSDWDVLHAGRPFANKCEGTPHSKQSILSNIAQAL